MGGSVWVALHGALARRTVAPAPAASPRWPPPRGACACRDRRRGILGDGLKRLAVGYRRRGLEAVRPANQFVMAPRTVRAQMELRGTGAYFSRACAREPPFLRRDATD